MTNLTATEVTNMYLFGQTNLPADLKDASLLRPKGIAGPLMTVDVNDYMANGPGRFAVAGDFEFIDRFFNSSLYADSAALKPGTYTKKQILTHFGYYDQNGKAVKDATYAIQQAYYDDGKDDFYERAYIWNTVAFKINDGASFVIESNGNRYIDNFSIDPYSKRNNQEDFDFTSSSMSSKVANYFLQPIVDPSGIGRSVPIGFDFSQGRTTTRLNFIDMMRASAQKTHASAVAAGRLALGADDLAAKLFQAGTIRFLDGDKPIIYGSVDGDNLSGTVTLSGFDITSTYSPRSILVRNRLAEFAKNGIVYVTGAGSDRVTGTKNNDVFYGGDGNDILSGGQGNDELRGEVGDDQLNGDDGNDTLKGGEGKDQLSGGKDNDTLEGEEDDDKLKGDSGDDSLSGGAGDDELRGGADKDTLDGGADNDKLYGDDGNDSLLGGAGNDELHGGADNDTLDGGADIDKLYGEDGNDSLNGGTGADELRGGSGNDTLRGGSGQDKLYGDENDDELYGDEFNDTLDGGSGADKLRGGLGYDTYIADRSDTINDLDGMGSVRLDQTVLTGGSRKKSDPENIYKSSDGRFTYTLSGSTLTVNGLTIENFANGRLGINLRTEKEPPKPPKPPKPDIDPPEKVTSPIVLDLDGDGVETAALANAYFDHDADGLSERSAWAKSDDGVLVNDLNEDGIIGSGRELFGNHTLLKNGKTAEHGYQALAEQDDNGDGVIDAADASYSRLKVWRDLNGDGFSNDGELFSLEGAGVKSISTRYTNSDFVDANGNAHKQVAELVLNNGTVTKTADVWFKTDSSSTVDNGAITLTEDVLGQPDARGFGQVHNLRQAMVLDPGIKEALAKYLAEADPTKRSELFDLFIYRWTGSADVDPKSRDPKKVYGHVMDARQLVTLEHLVGRGYMGTWCWGERDPNPHGNAAPLLIAEYQKFRKYTEAQINLQVFYAEECKNILPDFGSYSEGFICNASQIEPTFKALLDAGRIDKLVGLIKQLKDLYTYSWDLEVDVTNAYKAIASGNPTLAPYLDLSITVGTTRDDQLFGTDAGSVIHGLEGNDRLYGRGGNDSYGYSLGHGNDTLLDTGGVDQIVFGKGISASSLEFKRDVTTVWVKVKNAEGAVAGELRIDNFFDLNGDLSHGVIEKLIFTDGGELTLEQMLEKLTASVSTPGNDMILGSSEANTLSGLAGNDTIMGHKGDDTLNGNEGDDNLSGDDGNDSLDGGSGNDALVGGRGNDTYRFAAGHGKDTVNNFDDGGGRIDRIVFDASVSKASVVATRDKDDLLLTTSASDSVRVANYFNKEAAGGYAIDEIVFADGSIWTVADIKGRVMLATPGNDSISGYASHDTLSGLAGDDTLKGAAGNDVLNGNEGNDVVEGGEGDDQLQGEAGTDTLRGGEGNDKLDGGADNDFLAGETGDDTLIGGAGDDRLSGDAGRDSLSGGDGRDALEGGAGDDFLAGGREDDVLNGGAGTNSYLFARGDGRDTIVDNYEGIVTIYLADLPLDELIFRREGTGLTVGFKSSPADLLTLSAYFNDETPRGGMRIQYGNGSELVLTAEQLARKTLDGTDGDDTIKGFRSDDKITALAGNDKVLASTGNDSVDGGAGNDTLLGELGDDQIDGGDGDDSIIGGQGADTLSGGSGNDYLEGNDGDDVYIFGNGSGNDTVYDQAGTERIRLKDAKASDLLLRREGNDLLIRNLSSGDTLRINNHFSWQAGAAGEGAIESIELADGTIWDYEQIKLQAIKATGGADSIYGHADADLIDGLDGNDSISANDGDDTVLGGLGDDLIDGGSGNDSLTGGEGADNLQGQSGTDLLLGGAGNDQLQGGEDRDSLQGEAGDDNLDGGSGNDLLNGGEGNDTLAGGYDDDTLTGEDGTDQLDGNEGNDQLDGGNGNDKLAGGAGSDTLLGGAGDDELTASDTVWDNANNTLEGGTGNDTLYGSYGNDTYRFNLGDGKDLLIETRQDQAFNNIPASSDELVFGAGIKQADLKLFRIGDDLVVRHINGSDEITIQNWFRSIPSDHFKVDSFAFADGSKLDLAAIEALTVTLGTDGDDTLMGYRNNADTLRSGAGNDKLFGFAGNDALYGEDGDDTLMGGNGIKPDTGNDTLFGGAGKDQLFGEDGDDELSGDAGADYLEGGDGNDVLRGGADNDQLGGGNGDDRLFGDAGDDKYIYAAGQGVDVIDNTGGGFDGLFFTGDLALTRLTLTRDGDDLLVTVDKDPKQSVRVVKHFLGGDYAIDYIQPAGGNMLDTARINQIVAGGATGGQYDTVMEGTAAGEQMLGTQGKDWIRALGGNDQLYGFSGNDLLQGGDGDDTLMGGSGNAANTGDDSLEGGAGKDQLFGEDGKDGLKGEAGNDYLDGGEGNDTVDGGADDDQLSGGAGDDSLVGGAGNDKYVFSGAFGQDTIDNSGGGQDWIFFNDLDRSQLTFKQDGKDLVIGVVGDTSRSVRVLGHFNGGDAAVAYIQPKGGNALSAADIAKLIAGGGGAPTNQTLNGTAQADKLTGGAGNDTLNGLAGNDTLDGGLGNDSLVGGAGDD
ncbi:calcium-binding protein, partial [Parachitinimonas caeni]